MFGAVRLASELRDLGYHVEIVKGSDDQEYVIVHEYEIQAGQFAGRVIEMGLFAMQEYPRNIGSAIHIKAEPQLYETQNIPNVRNITESKLGPEWRYWSHNFNWTEERNGRRLMSQINTIFENA